MSETFVSVLPKFIDSLREKGRSPSTILAYRADLDQLISFLSERNKVEVTQIKQDDIESFRDFLISQKYTPKSVSRKLNAIKTFFKWMMESKFIVVDISSAVTHPKTESSLPKFLTQIEYRALRDICRTDKRIATIVELILQTGLRISEVSNLKRENIGENEVVIEAYATQPQRKVMLNKIAKMAIDEYLNENKVVEGFVFVSRNGKPLAIRNIRASVDRYIQKAEIGKFSVNDLRTTFIVENLKRGVDLVTISQAVGHKRLSTTERYLELAQVKETGKKQNLEEL